MIRTKAIVMIEDAGSTNDNATMNVWLHKAVIQKLSEYGGKAAVDLLD